MRTKLIESNKPERYINSVRNADSSAAAATIPVGTPLILNLSATPQPPAYSNGLPAGWEDGLQVVLPSTAAAANASAPSLFYFGVAAGPIVYPAYGEAVVSGVCMSAVVRATRSATTVSWASGATASVSGDALTIDTVNNAFGTAASAASAQAILLDNFATMAGSATNATDTRLAATVLLRTFVRQM